MTRPTPSIAPSALPSEAPRELYAQYASRCLEQFKGHMVAVVIAGPVDNDGHSAKRHGVLNGADAAFLQLGRGLSTEVVSLPQIAAVRHVGAFGHGCPKCDVTGAVT